jgi:thiamine biosynthesis lipoprotein
MTAITLGNASVVTSGSYRKYYERDGVRYSHTIDPATGYPVGHTLLSVSVIEDESWLADAMATAYMVMGLDKARAFIDAHPDGPGTRAVLFIYDDHGTLKIYATEEFNKLEINP